MEDYDKTQTVPNKKCQRRWEASKKSWIIMQSDTSAWMNNQKDGDSTCISTNLPASLWSLESQPSIASHNSINKLSIIDSPMSWNIGIVMIKTIIINRAH